MSITPKQPTVINNTRPLTAKGGIRAQTKSRKVGRNWWTKRWMQALEGLYMGAELPRGRAYAQGGQVLEIDIAHGAVKAKVQGHAKTPFSVTIKFKATPKEKWNKLTKTLHEEAYYTAKLLAGEMPESIEEIFRSHGIELFPANLQDLDTATTGPGNNAPDRHVIAVFYLLAEEFDRDPFLFMKLRGFDRDKMIKAIGKQKRRSAKKPNWVKALAAEEEEETTMDITEDNHLFWEGIEFNDEFIGDVRIPPVPGAISKHLGHFPMWRGEERFLDVLEMVYKKASQNGMDVFLGDW